MVYNNIKFGICAATGIICPLNTKAIEDIDPKTSTDSITFYGSDNTDMLGGNYNPVIRFFRTNKDVYHYKFSYGDHKSNGVTRYTIN